MAGIKDGSWMSDWKSLGVRESVMNNASIFTGDRTTHFKIVVAALICSTVVAGIGIAARMTDGPTSGSRLERAQGGHAGHRTECGKRYD